MHKAALVVPGRYSASIAVMKEMGWSWQDYDAAPADLVDEILTRMEAEGRWARTKRELDDAMEQARLRAQGKR
jgi:hypothetical protein